MFSKLNAESIHLISYTKLFIVLGLILLMPLLTNSKLLLTGVVTDGKVEDYGFTRPFGLRFRTPSTFSVIQFEAKGDRYLIYGARNVDYKLGEDVKVIYNNDDPSTNAILDFSFFYLDFHAILPGLLFIVWISVFHTVYQAKAKMRKTSTS